MTAGSRGTVLVVEDSESSAALLVDLVEAEGFKAAVCETAADALASQTALKPVAVLLDWGLPDVPGIEVCRELRARDQAVPIVFVSGRDDETSVARALEAGADDYVAKPVRPGELMARLEAHLRRVAALKSATNGHAAAARAGDTLRLGPLEIDLAGHRVARSGRPVRLGALEFKLLEYLARNAGTAISREQVLAEVYGYDADISSERVDLLVRRLRTKLGGDGGALIAAIPGYGYRLDRRAAPGS